MTKSLQTYGAEWKTQITQHQSSELFCDDFNGKKMEAVINDGVRAGEESKKSYDPYRIESLSADIAQSINSCMALERRYHDLRAQAENAFSEFFLFNEQYETLKSLETLPHAATQRDLEGKAHTAAAERFGEADDKLASGHQAFSQQMAAALEEAKLGEEQRVGLSQSKWEQIYDHKLKMLSRHVDPGGALNYGARAIRVREAPAGEIRAIAPKLFALSAGVARVFDVKISFLPATEAELITLQGVFDWVRTVATAVELATMSEVLLTYYFPLSALTRGKDKMSEVEELVANVNIMDLKSKRLRAVGLTLGRTDGNTEPAPGTNAKPNHASAVLTLPPQKDVWGSEQTFVRPRVQFPFLDMVNTRETPRNLTHNHSIRNISPSGQWKIKLRRSLKAEQIGASQGTDADLICLCVVVSGVR